MLNFILMENKKEQTKNCPNENQTIKYKKSQ